ncbi:unnamed protein product, partial [Effrenium voratum]
RLPNIACSSPATLQAFAASLAMASSSLHALLGFCLGLASLHLVFVALPAVGDLQGQAPAARGAQELPKIEADSPASAALRFGGGVVLGLVLLAAGKPAMADVEDVVIPVDDKGKTTTMTKEQVVRGKRLFNAACASCHVGGGTRTNQNVGLAIEELSGATPNRATVEGIVDYINNPTTYDGLKDISEVHPSIKGGDIWPKMRSMKQQDLYDMSAYILYQNQTIPEKLKLRKEWYVGSLHEVIDARRGQKPHPATLRAFAASLAMASSSLHALLGFCLGLASLHLVFVALPAVGDLQGQGPAARGAQELPKIEADSPASAALRFGGGVVLGLVLLAAGKPAMADVEDVVIPVDDKGKTTTMTKEQVVRGKRLFNAACASCHVGGGTRTNQNVGLAIEELSGATPNRATVEGIVDYINNPTTYDGLKDISEVHPSIKGGDIWPKMRS